MADRSASIRDVLVAAADWLARERDPAFTDWDGLVLWLEAHESHAREYQRLSMLDIALAKNLANDPPRLAETLTPVAVLGAKAVRLPASRRPFFRWSHGRTVTGALAAAAAGLALIFVSRCRL